MPHSGNFQSYNVLLNALNPNDFTLISAHLTRVV